MNLLKNWGATALGVIALVVALAALGGQSGPLGGTTNFDFLDTTDGYAVDGTTVIDTSGNWDGAVTAGSNSTFAGTVTVTGETNLDTLINGGDVTTLTAGATTTSAAEVCNSSVIQSDPGGASTTLTLPTTAALVADCVPTAGDHKQFILENLADAAENITVAAGTGMDLQEPDGQNVVIGQNNMGIVDIWVLTATTSIVTVNETIPAD